MRIAVGRVASVALWLAIIVAIALGAAGIVTGLDHPPGSQGRSDIVYAGDAEVTAMLDAAEEDLSTLTDQVEALGTQARGALAALNGADPVTSESAIAKGDQLVADIIARTARLRRDLAAVPYINDPTAGLVVSDPVVARQAALAAALPATQGLDLAWSRLTAGSKAATRMSGYLAEHDRLIGEAVAKGRLAQYGDAIKLIDDASLQIDAARAQRNDLVQTVDVQVLDEWLNRNGDYDAALRNLYRAIQKVGKKVDSATRAAVKAEAAARARLPPDTRGLVIIMADIGRGGMNGAVTTIELARAKLTDALAAATPETSAEPGATQGS